jgi:cyclopropane fatty-acyl-phospholipid synthase-like methyltransferase
MAKAAPRLIWAVETLAVQPGDQILEIGCGHGVAVSLICERLDGGHILAIDRSATMIEMAAKRNAAHVAAGRASFQAAPIHQAALGRGAFDKVLGVHVGVFERGDPARELRVIAECMRPGGALHLVYQPLVASETPAIGERLSATLERNGFAVRELLTTQLEPGPALCVIASPR